jgi:hypothetical protein
MRIICKPKCEEVMEAGEKCIMKGFITCAIHRTLLNDEMKENEMGGEYSTHGRGKKCI